MRVKKVSFKNGDNLTLRGCVHEPKSYDTCVIFLHGFPGSITNTAQRFCEAVSSRGHLCLRFNFSGSDKSDGHFRDKLMSKEVEDIGSAIDFMHKKYSFSHLFLVGHSTGAIDGALYAHRDKRVSGLVLLGGVSKLDEAVHYDFSDRQVRDFWRKGYITIPARKDKPKWWAAGKRLKKAFYDEFFTLDIARALKKYTKPLLIVHGTKDEAIPAQKDPVELYEMANAPKRLVLIEGADHRFSQLKHQRKVLREVLSFFNAHTR